MFCREKILRALRETRNNLTNMFAEIIDRGQFRDFDHSGIKTTGYRLCKVSFGNEYIKSEQIHVNVMHSLQ